MIPLKDKNPTRRFPAITILLIALNILVFMYQAMLGERLQDFISRFSLVPFDIYNAMQLHGYKPAVFMTLVSSLFLHGGWLHLGGNMLYLWIFGDNVEDKLGHGRYLFFYLLCGIAASSLHIYLNPLSTVPTIGASGAISGVLGAYLLLFPKAKVLTLVPIFIFIQIIELPAYMLLGFWFILQFFNGLLSLNYISAGSAEVAWWAHVGGFLTGLLLVLPMRKYR
jgi:membrane associated rhomboid family serine protease